VCVIGLGLLGQLTAQILRANGCQVFGIDISEEMVELGKKTSCHVALTRNDSDLESIIDQFTEGHGFDSVIITAAAQSNDPIELSTAILRQKGSIVIVGAVPMNIPREPHFYKKELELKISCSYGPGRYDHTYEEEGHDYPYGYVRWTENRNMAAFVKLLENKSVDVNPLISHVFDIEKAEKAYKLVVGKNKEKHIGILLRYPGSEEKQRFKTSHISHSSKEPEQIIRIGFIGAGSFAQKLLIPYAGSFGNLSTVVTSRGASAKSVGEKFKFREFSTDAQDVFTNEEINAVFIATRHNTHADLTIAALEAGKNVFVEKPLAILEKDLDRIAHIARKESSKRLMVGFNRRFSPLAKQAKQLFNNPSEPLLINYRINAGFIPKDHWIQTDEGGGRILGEVCHFVDLLQYLTGSEPTSVFAESINSVNSKMVNHDNVTITLRFMNGSVGNIIYLACGDKLLSKERVEIFGGGKTFIINDFKVGESYVNGSRKKIKQPGKGYKEEVELFFKSILEGHESPIPFDSVYKTTATTFRIIDSLRTGLPQNIAF
jgi:polar amino acid transport system substrate-binding protein